MDHHPDNRSSWRRALSAFWLRVEFGILLIALVVGFAWMFHEAFWR